MVKAFIENMSPSLKEKLQTIKETQETHRNILKNHENFDEIKHLRIDIDFDESFIE